MHETVSFESSLVSRHKCDICKNEAYAIYIPGLDKWYCNGCIQTARDIIRGLERCEFHPQLHKRFLRDSFKG